MEGSIEQWIWLIEEEALEVPGEGEQLHSRLELKRDEAMIAQRFRGTTRCARNSQGWGRGEKRSLHSPRAGVSSGYKDVLWWQQQQLLWRGLTGWTGLVRAGAISRDILPPRLVPLAVVTVILKRQCQLHPLYPCPGCGPQKINVTFEKRLR